MRYVEWDPVDLLPPTWLSPRISSPFRVFNPAILAHGDGFLLAYRAVLADGIRRIGLCRLDAQFRVLPGSPGPWSDHVPSSPPRPLWFADPRLYSWSGRLYLYWNTGWGDDENAQYLQELNPQTLLPAAPPRPLTLAAPRQRIEKNWMLFGPSPAQAIYFPRPLRLLRFAWPDTVLHPAGEFAWDDAGYEATYGPLRGGAPPAPDSDGFWCVTHSVAFAPDGFRYWPALLRFRSDGRVTHRPNGPLPLPNPYRCRRRLPRLNPYAGQVLYPSGLARSGPDWAISYGINDERCALAVLTAPELAAAVERIPS
ncbi:MAG: hypothetical protein K7J47_01595 [Acidobacteria bacterium]|jgi:hypothetical protein|nr:hypothetical protein [Bryobacteraceae bacterium CoA2 C42]